MKQIILNDELTTYYITEDGRLFNEKTSRWYKGSNSGGYLKYDLVWKDKKYAKFAHRLVAEYYLDNQYNLPIVNHKDGNKLNNHVSNLEWCNYSENNIHAYESGLKEKSNGISERQKFEKNLPNEKWLRFRESNYEISNFGRIKSTKTGNLLKGKITSKGYVEWCLCLPEGKKSFLAHRLVFGLFGSEEIDSNKVINHIDGNKTNNSISNLEQVEQSKNIAHSYYSIGHSNVKKVGKYDLNMNLLEIYESCADAARKNPGCYSNNISNVCNGKMKTHHGYIWKYLDKE